MINSEIRLEGCPVNYTQVNCMQGNCIQEIIRKYIVRITKLFAKKTKKSIHKRLLARNDKLSHIITYYVIVTQCPTKYYGE